MTEQPSSFSKITQRGKAILLNRPLRYTLATLAALFLLFGVAGYFWLPGFAKQKAEALLTEEFGRPVRIGKIKISPYALSATISGFSIGQKSADGPDANGTVAPPVPNAAQNATDAELFGFDSLSIDLSTASLRGIPVVSEVRLTGPRLHLVRQSDGRLNVSDLLDKWTSGPSSPTPEFSVANITIEGGHFVFVDQKQQGRHMVTDLSLGIPFIANTAGTVESHVQPKFSAKVNGAVMTLAGAVRPFAPGKDATLELNLSDFDLMRVFQYAPQDLPFQLQSARLDARLNVAFSQPNGKNAVLRLSGQSALSGVSATLTKAQGQPLRVRLGKADLRLDEATLAGVVRCTLGLQDVALTTGDAKEPFVGFTALELAGVNVSTSARKAEVGELRLSKPFGRITRRAGGEVDIVTALEGLGAAKASAKPANKFAAKPTAKTESKMPAKATEVAQTKKMPDAKSPAAKPPAAWTWRVGRVAISDGNLRYTDTTLGAKVRPLEVKALALTLDGFSSAAAPAKLTFAAKVNEHGTVMLGGTVQHAPAVAAELDLDMAHVDLVALQGLAETGIHAVLTRGEASAKGRILADGRNPDAFAASFKGDVSLVDFSVLDKVNSADLLRWRSLKLSGLDAGSAPLRVGIDEIAISNFFVRALLTAEGRLNLNDVLRSEQNHEASAQAKATEPKSAAKQPDTARTQQATAAKPPTQPAAAAQAPPGPAPVIRIGRIVLKDGNINFTDRFIKPHYTANLTDLSGQIGALKAGTLTDVAIRGKVDRTGPLDISGKLDPLGKPLNLDIKAKATGIEMSGFSPYSGRYVGYAIEKGKLSVDVHYTVEAGKLKAENKIFLDQLTFGKKVDHPEAMNVPVNLLVALLSNSRGEIDINLPVEGSLDDPEFSVGGIIVKVLLNLITKAVTSPFSLLASLFSGGEDLSYVAFEPGRTALTPEAEKHLEGLAKALQDRPGLKLELAGSADPAVEEQGLKRARLEFRVKAQKATELARQGKASGGVAEITLTEEEYARYLERVYKASDVKKPRNLIGIAKTLPVEQMETLLLDNAPLGVGGMERLARDRGIAVQEWLVEKGGIDQARVFLLAPRVGVEPPKGVPAGGRVDFSLR
jgi:hypothetical protein